MSEYSLLMKVNQALSDSVTSEWCIVDVYNNFKFGNQLFIIDESVDEYKVYNRSDEMEDYTNEATMDRILAVFTNDGDYKFYDQNCNSVEKVRTVMIDIQ